MTTKSHQRDLETLAVATYSQCENYRYSLVITWDSTRPRMMVIGLNPSTATEVSNDPTIRRLENSARKNNYGSLAMFNAYAYRSTDPKQLWKQVDPVGPMNDELIVKSANDCQIIICAWGNNIQRSREIQIIQMIYERMGAIAWDRLQCFHLTKCVSPGHPLYLKTEQIDNPYPLGLNWFHKISRTKAPKSACVR